MCPAKVSPEAVFGNAVAPVSAAFVPVVVFMLPVLRPVVLPNVVVGGVFFAFVYLVIVCRLVGGLVVRLRMIPIVVVIPLLLVGALFLAMFRHIRVMLV